jgi:two-component system copper resistance phosphate regulon response regulator CusR
MSRILIVEDDPRLSTFLAKGLRSAGFTPTACHDGNRAAALASDAHFDLILLDIGLPGQDGFAVLRHLRGLGQRVPVVVLSGHDEVTETISALDSGADDYVTKPFSFEELLARLRVRLRGAGSRDVTRLRAGDLELDLRRHRVRLRGADVMLTSRELSVLEALVRHAGQVLSREELLSHGWGHEYTAASNLVDVYIRYLRRKLGPGVIDTVRGAGYRVRP